MFNSPRAESQRIDEFNSLPITNPDLLWDMISTSFPQASSDSKLSTVQIDLDKIPEVTTEKVLEATKKIVLDLEGIPNKGVGKLLELQ